MERENLATTPLRMRKGTLKKDKSKYCDYHNGHDTEKCIHFKEKIEDLIRQRLLKNFVQRQDQRGKKFEKNDYHNQGCNNNNRRMDNFQKRNQGEGPRNNQIND